MINSKYLPNLFLINSSNYTFIYFVMAFKQHNPNVAKPNKRINSHNQMKQMRVFFRRLKSF